MQSAQPLRIEVRVPWRKESFATDRKEIDHETCDLGSAGRRTACRRIPGQRGVGSRAVLSALLSQLPTQSPVLLSLLLLPAQLLAGNGPALAGTAGCAIHASAGLSSVSGVPRAWLAV